MQVTFAVATGGGSITSAVDTTDASGIARVGSWTLGTATGANTGTGIVGTLANAGTTGTATYEIRFNVAGSVTTYDIWNATTSAYLSTGTAYQPGTAITVDALATPSRTPTRTGSIV